MKNNNILTNKKGFDSEISPFYEYESDLDQTNTNEENDNKENNSDKENSD